MYEDAKRPEMDRAYRGNQLTGQPQQEKHMNLLESINRLAAFSERLNCFGQRLAGEDSPICGSAGIGGMPSLAYALDQSPREINELVDRMNKQLDTIIGMLYG